MANYMLYRRLVPWRAATQRSVPEGDAPDTGEKSQVLHCEINILPGERHSTLGTSIEWKLQY